MVEFPIFDIDEFHQKVRLLIRERQTDLKFSLCKSICAGRSRVFLESDQQTLTGRRKSAISTYKEMLMCTSQHIRNACMYQQLSFSVEYQRDLTLFHSSLLSSKL